MFTQYCMDGSLNLWNFFPVLFYFLLLVSGSVVDTHLEKKENKLRGGGWGAYSGVPFYEKRSDTQLRLFVRNKPT